ncbi:sensor histidine kinase [Derxia lacustris]|uniref:sensor histidine kinase n=1 Tax=Derxia lacustris TaxID=764842 RepID=UPI000A170B1D|nr:sensor histidine kinase [Derxia lacustris]
MGERHGLPAAPTPEPAPPPDLTAAYTALAAAPPANRALLDEAPIRPAPSPADEADPNPQAAPYSLFGEILDWMLAPLLLLWPMSIAVTYLVAQSIANTPFDRALEATVRTLAQQVQVRDHRLVFDFTEAAREILHADDATGVYYQVWSADGQVLSGDRNLAPPFPPGVHVEDEMTVRGIVRFRPETMGDDQLRVASLYLDPSVYAGAEETADAPVLVQVAETLEKRAQLASEIVKGVILPQFLILPIAVLLVWAGLSRGILPLNQLQRRIRARSPDDLSPINPNDAPEELLPLIESFNDLLARLDTTVTRQRRFIADAAHQMKTPLAGLRTQAELALREHDPAELRRRLHNVADSTDRATRLINQLLALARAEAQTVQAPPLESVELVGLARDVVSDMFERALDKHIDLGLDAPDEPVPVLGMPVMLAELVKNLVDNALRYTPPGGAVTVRITPGQGQAALEVEDTGPGVPEAERPLVFERFYRVLGSGQDGSGLGLAIVREIAVQHGAEIQLTFNPRAPAFRAGATEDELRLPGCLVSVTLRSAFETT